MRWTQPQAAASICAGNSNTLFSLMRAIAPHRKAVNGIGRERHQSTLSENVPGITKRHSPMARQ